MSDLIKREDAVKTVIRKCSPICAWQVGTQQYPDCVVAEINALPSADAEWIPVSERLPEVTDTVLVQDVCGDIETAEVCMDYDESLVFYGEWEYKLEELVAWMPLPTPYKGGDDE